jgi:hypothetical protein
VGLFVSRRPKAILLAFASFVGLCVSIWSTFGPLFLPIAAQLVTRFELLARLLLSFIAGAVQAVAVVSAGFGVKELMRRALARHIGNSPSKVAVADQRLAQSSIAATASISISHPGRIRRLTTTNVLAGGLATLR